VSFNQTILTAHAIIIWTRLIQGYLNYETGSGTLRHFGCAFFCADLSVPVTVEVHGVLDKYLDMTIALYNLILDHLDGKKCPGIGI
jgi:hypothetical protein